MASKTQIANRALTKLGQGRVSNIETDGSVAAITINQIWDTVRDATLQMYPWNFAIKRTDLAPDADAPSWGWSTAFTLPSDCLQLLEIKDDIEYELERGKILCDQAEIIYIRYIYKVTDPAMYPPIFVEVLAHDLAIESCDKITDDTSLKNLLIAERTQIMNKALATDSVENITTEIIEDTWLTARL